MRNVLLQEKLAAEVLDKLDPDLRSLYSQTSTTLSRRVATLVNKALPLRIEPNRLVKYAFLYATAEREARSDAVSREHASRSWSELAGGIHGLETGYWDQVGAGSKYKLGRRARQQISAGLQSVVSKWTQCEKVVNNHRAKLPANLHKRFSAENLTAIRKSLDYLGIGLEIEPDVLRQNAGGRDASVRQRTLMHWRFAIPRYRGKWSDMHRLAVA